MAIIKGIFIFFIGLYALSRIVVGMDNSVDNQSRMVNLIEIVVSILLTLAIFKI